MMVMVMVMVYPVVVLPCTSLAQRDRPCPCPCCICTYIPHLCSPPLTPTCFARPACIYRPSPNDDRMNELWSRDRVYIHM